MPSQARQGCETSSILEGWQATALVAATYVYFLIFAQFGFLKRLDQLALSQGHLKTVMACMGLGGILSSLASPRWQMAPGRKLRLAFFGCATAAALSVTTLNVVLASATATLIGISLGLLTVTLVTHLPLWTGARSPLWKVGVGTGLGYAICNIPALFNGSPQAIAWTAAGFCILATSIPQARTSAAAIPASAIKMGASFVVVLAGFTALVWLDSAAFFIIQNSPMLKAGTWAGDVHLWRNGAVHLIAALLSVILIRRRGLLFTLVCGYACLAGACLLLHHPEEVIAASWLYPAGVSLYSVALVAAPAFLLFAHSERERGNKAGLIYAIAGWGGSSLGIGMAQNLHSVPTVFIVVAGVLIVGAWVVQVFRDKALTILALGSVFGLSAVLYQLIPRTSTPPANEIAYGRRVYIQEGCIHCHSQYVRPHSHDVLLWGPAQNVEIVRHEKPPLIGNRRQGPDLSEVGSRRSPLWLRIHFYKPDAVSYDSIMPSYRDLFKDSRGDALIAYLTSLRTKGVRQHELEEISEWSPSISSGKPSASGAVLFQHYCATCHSANGAVRRQWASSFAVPPPDLNHISLADLPTLSPQETPEHRLERIIKFGIPGTDMPGHEYLDDADVKELSRYITQLPSASPNRGVEASTSD